MAQLSSGLHAAPAMRRGGWLDLMRLVAASLLVIHHFHEAAPVDLARFHPVFERGFLLTDFFLIDSGYVLARLYADRIGEGATYGAFLRKRFIRLWPSHLAMAALLALMVLLAGGFGVAPSHPQWFDWREFPAQLFLVQAYGVPGGHGWNAPTWSISALLGCYVVFPLFVRVLWRLRPLTAFAGAVAVYLAADALTHRVLDLPVYWMPLQYGFWRAAPHFFLGVALARASEGLPLAPKTAGRLGLGALVALVGLQAFGPFALVSLGLVATMILAAGAVPVTRPSRAIASGALASFAIYISNEVVRIGYFGLAEQLERRVELTGPAQWAVWAGGVLSAFVFAFGFYLVFDRPTQAWLNRAAGRRRNTAAATVAPGESPRV